MVTVLCECGCGLPAPIPDRDRPHIGHVKGEPRRFVQGHGAIQRNLLRSGRPLYEVREMGYRTPCWVWLHGLASHGYARITKLTGVRVYAHAYFWEQENGPVPDGLELDHLCRIRHCVNPSHLEAVTPAVNVSRGYAARRGRCACVEADWDRGVALRAAGMTYQAVADEIGVDLSSAWRRLKGVPVGTC